MNRFVGLKEQNSAVSIAEESYQSGDIATLGVFEKDFQYALTVDTLYGELQPCRKERANYGNQLFVLDKTYENKVYRFSFDKKGLDDITIFRVLAAPQTIALNPSPIAENTTWASRFIETDISAQVELGLRVTVERLMKFAMLEPNWDSYNAEPIKWETISRAIGFFTRVIVVLNEENKRNSPVPFVAPVSDGSIQFEWRTYYKELIVTIPAQSGDNYEYFKAEKDIILGEMEESGNMSNAEDVVGLAKDWLLS